MAERKDVMSYYPPVPQQPTWHQQSAPVSRLLTFRTTRGPAAAATVMTLVTILGLVVQTAVSFVVSPALADAAAFGSAADGAGVLAYNGVTLLTQLSFLAAGALAMLWLSQVRVNAAALSPGVQQAHTVKWASLGWIVPVVALWFPLQVVRDVRHAMNPQERTRRLPPVLDFSVAVWWGAFLLSEVLYVILAGVAGNSPTNLSAAHSLAAVNVLVTLGAVVSGLLWVSVVRSTENLQSQRLAQIALPPTTAPRTTPGPGEAWLPAQP